MASALHMWIWGAERGDPDHLSRKPGHPIGHPRRICIFVVKLDFD